jgi:hypothetical protein
LHYPWVGTGMIMGFSFSYFTVSVHIVTSSLCTGLCQSIDLLIGWFRSSNEKTRNRRDSCRKHTIPKHARTWHTTPPGRSAGTFEAFTCDSQLAADRFTTEWPNSYASNGPWCFSYCRNSLSFCSRHNSLDYSKDCTGNSENTGYYGLLCRCCSLEGSALQPLWKVHMQPGLGLCRLAEGRHLLQWPRLPKRHLLEGFLHKVFRSSIFIQAVSSEKIRSIQVVDMFSFYRLIRTGFRIREAAASRHAVVPRYQVWTTGPWRAGLRLFKLTLDRGSNTLLYISYLDFIPPIWYLQWHRLKAVLHTSSCQWSDWHS